VNIDSSAIPGVYVITPSIHRDRRGEFAETYSVSDYEGLSGEDGAPLVFLTDAISVSHAGVLRGLHGDERTFKLIQCLHGRVYLVVVDLRAGSATFGRWESHDLSAQERIQLLIPPGCVNGHYVHEDKSVVAYKQSTYYQGAATQRSVRWNDPQLGISWPSTTPLLSERDAQAPLLAA
jgi:dTDP-4-dehydrorhamnose 3,5-epimerase